MKKFRVRCAPSPSGQIHIGNAKTFLFNYLFSRKYDADFILRIEDTDTARVVLGGAEKLLAELKWLGLAPTMGWGTDNCPAGNYTQMGRLPVYKKYVDDLLNKGLAYKCYCTEQQLNSEREKAIVANPKAPYKYPGTCRTVGDLDKPYVIRFKAPTDGSTSFEDIAFGSRQVPNKENYDFVIFRQNGIPLFNFANCIDDLAIDGITHVIRGSDHLKNTPQQVMLTDALGFERPAYCHLPMLLNAAGGKLSKRDGSVSVAEYREMGYTPAGILNYLVRFGWGHKNQEVFSMDELVSLFDIHDCGKNDGKFDPKKFAAIQYEHLKSQTLTPDEDYVALLFPFLIDKGYLASHKGTLSSADKNTILRALPLIRSRAKTLMEAADEMMIFLQDVVVADKQYADCGVDRKQAESIITAIESTGEWNADNVRHSVNGWLTEKDLKLKDIGVFLRLALTGRERSPELFQVAAGLARAKSLNRLHGAARRL